jgi:hypothetical protein
MVTAWAVAFDMKNAIVQNLVAQGHTWWFCPESILAELIRQPGGVG